MTNKPVTTRLKTEEQLELPNNCNLVQNHIGGRVLVYWGKKQVLIGEGLTEDDAIISAYKCLIKNHLRDVPK